MREYPKFVRPELIVNAVTHRAYSITGTDIQIKMFDDYIVVESPGKLPGLVKVDNIRFTHFSRNPKIAEFLKNYKFVKEFGEGVNRMCNELEQVGLKDPVYHTNAFMLQAVIYNSKVGKTIIEKTADSLKKLAVAVNKSLIDYQKPAIGEEKLNFAKQIAKENHCYKMMLLTGSKEESTLIFYRSAGYNSSDKTAFIQWIDM